ELVEAREPLAALLELDRLADSPRAQDADVQVVRGKAEHGVGQLGPAFADFAAAARQGPSSLDEGALAALVDLLPSQAFPAVWRPALVKLLGEELGRSVALEVRPALSSPKARSRNDALQVLELAGVARDEDRLAVSRADLADSRARCSVRKAAVRRLARVPGAEAESLLARTASEPRACGRAEARDASRKRQDARVAAAQPR